MKLYHLCFFIFAVSGLVFAQTPTVTPSPTAVGTPIPFPDFSYLNQSFADNQYERYSLGKFDAPRPYQVPAEVLKAFSSVLNNEWQRWASATIERTMRDKEAAKRGLDSPAAILKNLSEPEGLALNFGPIYKIDLSKVFGSKQLYVLRVVNNEQSTTYYLALYDRKTAQCTADPAKIGLIENIKVIGTEDVLGNGGRELKLQSETHGGTSSDEKFIQYYSFAKDLSIKEVFAYMNYYSNGMDTNEVNTFDPKSPEWKKAVKNFVPKKDEEHLGSF